MSNSRREVETTPAGLQWIDDHGQKRSVRYIDLWRRLHLPEWDCEAALPRLEAVRIESGTLFFSIADKDYETTEKLVTTPSSAPMLLRNTSAVMTCRDDTLGLIPKGSVYCHSGKIQWVGPDHEFDRSLMKSDTEEIDLGGRLLTPGLVDCHAHPLFAGNRAHEFTLRSEGAEYQQIASEGGGINATVLPTRGATFNQLVQLAAKRMRHAIAWGTTTMEAKSGYDLRVDGELRLLQVAAAVDALQPVDLVPTLLGAHVIPTEFTSDRNRYVEMVISEMIPKAANTKLATGVDVYCDEGAFTLRETERILQRAKAEGLALRAHIGQFADLGGAQLLAKMGALSGDHLEQVSTEGIAALASANVIATMLPGACVQLKMRPPPVAQLRNAGVRMAIASDLNPGSSHCGTLLVPMWLATTHYEMSVNEAWLGVTRHGAAALARNDIGQIAVGARADLVAWDAEIPGEIPYHFGSNLVHQVIKDGVVCAI